LLTVSSFLILDSVPAFVGDLLSLSFRDLILLSDLVLSLSFISVDDFEPFPNLTSFFPAIDSLESLSGLTFSTPFFGADVFKLFSNLVGVFLSLSVFLSVLVVSDFGLLTWFELVDVSCFLSKGACCRFGVDAGVTLDFVSFRDFFCAEDVIESSTGASGFHFDGAFPCRSLTGGPVFNVISGDSSSISMSDAVSRVVGISGVDRTRGGCSCIGIDEGGV
jgi:hypothetical protein